MNRVSRGQLANRFFSKFHASPVTAAPTLPGQQHAPISAPQWRTWRAPGTTLEHACRLGVNLSFPANRLSRRTKRVGLALHNV